MVKKRKLEDMTFREYAEFMILSSKMELDRLKRQREENAERWKPINDFMELLLDARSPKEREVDGKTRGKSGK